MCGINGFAGRPKEGARTAFETFYREVMLGTEKRGHHATGIAAYRGSNRSVVGKGPVPASAFVKTPVWEKALRSLSAIGHCRYATHGSPSRNENNHPFESGRWALVHNGVILGHTEIARREGVNLSSECDSEIIIRVFARGAKQGGSPKAGLQKFVDAINGHQAGYAVALLDRTNGKIRLLRDESRPCAIVRLPALGAVFFASTAEILREAMEKTLRAHDGFPLLDGADGWECIRGRVYVIDPNTLEVEHEEIKVPETRTLTLFGSLDGRFSDAETGGGPRNGGVIRVCDTCGEYICRCEELTSPAN
jgi:glucosamine 6-phosphate synthetase-like amidotransferase/phosphosugar isomerase protein